MCVFPGKKNLRTCIQVLQLILSIRLVMLTLGWLAGQLAWLDYNANAGRTIASKMRVTREVTFISHI